MTHRAPDGSANSQFLYSYDAVGQQAGMQTLHGEWAYEYDPIGQMVHATFVSTSPAVSNQDLRYEYDAAETACAPF